VAVADKLRTDAKEMISRLHDNGVKKVVMLTGDTRRVAEAVAADVGVDEVRAELLPEDKLTVVQQLQSEGYTLAMVGDGVNDAPALATADIGVAMGAAGTGVAIETADIALMKDDLLKLPQAIGLARSTISVMRQNIAIALITVVALLAGVVTGGVTMAIGMLVHEASVLLVIVNAMRLMRRREQACGASRTVCPRHRSARPTLRGLAGPPLNGPVPHTVPSPREGVPHVCSLRLHHLWRASGPAAHGARGPRAAVRRDRHRGSRRR